MNFDSFTIVLLVTGAQPPELDEQAADALQDAHLAYLAELHDAGHLLAVGPVQSSLARGVAVYGVEPERARELAEADPAVRAGRFAVEVMPWRVPAGVIEFPRDGRLPRSMADVRG